KCYHGSYFMQVETGFYKAPHLEDKTRIPQLISRDMEFLLNVFQLKKEDTMKDLFVSIVIITRNRPFLLRHCIERVLVQPYPHKEVIVVDSSSNDESEQIVAQHPEVISLRLYGQGNNMPQARNAGIAASCGDI